MGFSFQDLIGVVVLVGLIATPIALWKRKKRIIAVVFGLVVGLLWIAIALASFERSRTFTSRAARVNNLKAIQNAKKEWARRNNKQSSDVPTEEDLVGDGKQLPEMPKCWAGGTFTIGAVNQKPTCSLANQGHQIPDEEH